MSKNFEFLIRLLELSVDGEVVCVVLLADSVLLIGFVPGGYSSNCLDFSDIGSIVGFVVFHSTTLHDVMVCLVPFTRIA